MKKIAEKLYNEKKITLEEFNACKDMTKEAFLGQLGKGGIRDAVQTIGLAALTGALGVEAASKLKGLVDQKTAYHRMMEKNEILSEYPEEEVKDYYEVVRTFSPKSASNPLVAGALVNKMIQFGGVDHKLVQDLSSIEGPHKDAILEFALNSGKGLMQMKVDDE